MSDEVMEVKYRALCEGVKPPTYGTDDSAGADIRANVAVTIEPLETKLIGTGLSVAIPKGYVGLMFPRSGLSYRTPLRQPNSVGVIDSDYRGEVKGMFTNVGNEPVSIERGDRIAQMVVVPYVKCRWTEVENLDETVRGEGGFGSTGIK